MKTTIIGIAGGTASGKTSIAKKLYNQSLTVGSVVVIKLDDYYNDLTHMPLEDRRKVNYDHPSSYDTKLFLTHLNELKDGKPINKPTYDFILHNRAQKTEEIKPSNVIIVEGIMIFAIPELRDVFDIKIFVDTPDDVRFIRRLKRDIRDRGRDVTSVINQYLNTVRPMHLQFVEPSKRFADIIIPEGGENVIAIDLIVTKIFQLLQ